MTNHRLNTRHSCHPTNTSKAPSSFMYKYTAVLNRLTYITLNRSHLHAIKLFCICRYIPCLFDKYDRWSAPCATYYYSRSHRVEYILVLVQSGLNRHCLFNNKNTQKTQQLSFVKFSIRRYNFHCLLPFTVNHMRYLLNNIENTNKYLVGVCWPTEYINSMLYNEIPITKC